MRKTDRVQGVCPPNPLFLPRRLPHAGARHMAAAETVKTTVDTFTAASSTAFKDGVEKTLSALNEANTHSKKNLEAVVASVTAATKGAEALGAQAMAYSKAGFESQVAAAK